MSGDAGQFSESKGGSYPHIIACGREHTINNGLLILFILLNSCAGI